MGRRKGSGIAARLSPSCGRVYEVLGMRVVGPVRGIADRGFRAQSVLLGLCRTRDIRGMTLQACQYLSKWTRLRSPWNFPSKFSLSTFAPGCSMPASWSLRRNRG